MIISIRPLTTDAISISILLLDDKVRHLLHLRHQASLTVVKVIVQETKIAQVILFHSVENLGLADLNSYLMLRVVTICQATPHRTLLVLTIAQAMIGLADSCTHTTLVSTIVVLLLDFGLLVLNVIFSQHIHLSAIV